MASGECITDSFNNNREDLKQPLIYYNAQPISSFFITANSNRKLVNNWFLTLEGCSLTFP